MTICEASKNNPSPWKDHAIMLASLGIFHSNAIRQKQSFLSSAQRKQAQETNRRDREKGCDGARVRETV